MLPLAKPDIARTLFALRSIACACFSRIFCAVFRCFLFCLLVLLVLFSSAASSSFCFRPRRLSFERNPFISSRALEREETFTSSSLKRRLAMMIFLALYSRAQLLLTCEKKPDEKQRRFSRNTVERVRFCCLARRQRDLSGERCVPNERHAHATTTQQHQTDSG